MRSFYALIRCQRLMCARSYNGILYEGVMLFLCIILQVIGFDSMRKLIINADDFGLDEHTVEWTIKGFDCGALTSATIMAGMPATELAVEYAKRHPKFSFGVHFYLVDESPISNPKEIKSMIDPRTGKLWRTRDFNFAIWYTIRRKEKTIL